MEEEPPIALRPPDPNIYTYFKANRIEEKAEIIISEVHNTVMTTSYIFAGESHCMVEETYPNGRQQEKAGTSDNSLMFRSG